MNKNKPRTIAIIVIVIAVLIVLAGFVTYAIRFHGKLSTQAEDWGYFAGYQSYFISVCSLVLLGYISYITYTTSRKFSLLQHRPYLVITLEAPIDGSPLFRHTDRTYHIRNATAVPAINVLVRHKLDRKQEFTKWIASTAVAPNASTDIPWVQFPDVIEVCFSDIEAENFFLYKYVDSIGTVVHIGKTEYNQYLTEAIQYRDLNAEHLRTKLTAAIHQEITVNHKSFNDAMTFFNNETIIKNLL